MYIKLWGDMSSKRKFIVPFILLTSAIAAHTAELVLAPALLAAQTPAQSASGQNAATRRIGAIKAINGSTIALAPDSGSEITVTVQPGTRVLRLAPGEKDLKNATPIPFQDLQVGDRILVGGAASEDTKSIAASVIVAMKRSDLEARQKEDLQDWQKRGVDGVVKALDPASGTISLSVPGFGGGKELAVHTTKATVMLRYPAGSANFADAKPSSLSEMRTGDQFHARGDRSADGSELTAEEVVFGTFRNIAGTINSVDATSGTIDVQDVLSKKSLQVKVNADSQLRKLPAEAARLVLGFKGGAADRPASGSNPAPVSAGGERPAAPGGMSPGGSGSAGGPRLGRFDLNRVLSRMPAVGLSDLHKGDAVMIVAAEGRDGDVITKLLAGVEPILQAAPSAGQALMLTPWNLGGAPSGDNGNP